TRGVFVDLGANIGAYTVPLARYASRVVAIEPNPEMLDRLSTNLVASEVYNVAVVPAAIGDREYNATLKRNTRNLGSSSIATDGDLPVRMRPLTAVLDEHCVDTIAALKADIENFEDRALLPFFANAPRSRWPARVVIEESAAGKRCVAH